jgi:DNA recombination protein RmuC
MTTLLLWILIGVVTLLVIGVVVLIYLVTHPKTHNHGMILEKQIEMLIKQNSDTLVTLTEKNGDLKEHLSNVVYENNKKISEDMSLFTTKMMENLSTQMDKINAKVEEKLGSGFDQANQTFNKVIERLVRIDEAQKQIEKLSTDVVSLNEILSDKKTRGTFGEIQLKQLFSAIFGDKNDLVYETQKTLSNGTVVDFLLHAPEPLGDICIDSKFPLENYKKMMDNTLSDEARLTATKTFKQDIKKHIDMISSKYIITNQTTDQAIMFIPAEAIFAEINSRHEELILYAQSKRVWLSSPTTLMSTLTIVQVILKDLKRSEFSKLIQQELSKLSIEFERYQERWDKLLKNIKTVNNQAEDVKVTSEKISKRFKAINSVEVIEENETSKFDTIDEPFILE